MTFSMVTKLGKKSDEPIFKQVINLIHPSGLAKSISKFKSDKSCSKYYTYDHNCPNKLKSLTTPLPLLIFGVYRFNLSLSL